MLMPEYLHIWKQTKKTPVACGFSYLTKYIKTAPES
jgi:hypothetical protein